MLYDELCRGVLTGESRVEFRRIAGALIRAGAEGVVFGCAEITLAKIIVDNRIMVDAQWICEATFLCAPSIGSGATEHR